MDTQHDIALTRALTQVPGPLPSSGVIHVVIPHTGRFTIVGNHLAQHAELSLTAIGIGVHIQSLPAGSKVGIKALAARFPEGETKIASALRELENHGYLHRPRMRLANGWVVTRTVFCNQPRAVVGPTVRGTAPAPTVVREPTAVPEPGHVPEPTPVPEPITAPEPIPLPEGPHAPARLPARTAPKQPRRPLPHPRALSPELRQTASTFLADLRRHAEELVLSEEAVEELVPGVAAWLERDTTTDTLRHTLTADLPKPLKHPARLLRHRLTALLPPPLPGIHDLAPSRRAPVTPFQTCDGCERAFRSHHPGHCRDCRAQYGVTVRRRSRTASSGFPRPQGPPSANPSSGTRSSSPVRRG
ncbi:hypothetical protein [Streptomyces griseus]|uniref:hypothetical protein n=1 Tax=Streptomyces griseus TaxID=1911 RepID=UPI0022593469|nr:hypothetical protein [Streptomyces griseus]MCX4709257.1 helix-turn-helix domain-containing protein [Streptomyces griseus]